MKHNQCAVRGLLSAWPRVPDRLVASGEAPARVVLATWRLLPQPVPSPMKSPWRKVFAPSASSERTRASTRGNSRIEPGGTGHRRRVHQHNARRDSLVDQISNKLSIVICNRLTTCRLRQRPPLWIQLLKQQLCPLPWSLGFRAVRGLKDEVIRPNLRRPGRDKSQVKQG